MNFDKMWIPISPSPDQYTEYHPESSLVSFSSQILSIEATTILILLT